MALQMLTQALSRVSVSRNSSMLSQDPCLQKNAQPSHIIDEMCLFTVYIIFHCNYTFKNAYT